MFEINWLQFWSTFAAGLLSLFLFPWVIRGIGFLLTIVRKST